MIKLEKGAPVRVRLHTGEVVEAVYSCLSVAEPKSHLVYVKNVIHRAVRFPRQVYLIPECRFVGNPCKHLVPVGVSV